MRLKTNNSNHYLLKIQLYLGLTISILSIILLFQVLLFSGGTFNSTPSNLFYYHPFVEDAEELLEINELLNSQINESLSNSQEFQEILELFMLNNIQTQFIVSNQNLRTAGYNYIYFLIIVLVLGLFITINALNSCRNNQKTLGKKV